MARILYEDAQIILCEKDPKTVCQTTADGDNLLSWLAGVTQDKMLYPVHRTDAMTGGVVCVARDPETAKALSEAFAAHRVYKEYLCVVPNRPTEQDGEMRDYLYWTASARKSFVTNRARRGAKEAVLEYHVLQTVSAAGDVSLVRVVLHTGRTHQIRVQFASRKMPLLGDGKYGSREKGCRTALWSHRVVLPDGRGAVSRPPDCFPWNLFSPESLQNGIK